MDIGAIFGTILWPIKWVVELILVAFHELFTVMGMDPAAGITWVLSIVGLTVVVRAALIPVFVRQIKNQRRMLEVAPQLKKIQDKYKGKKWQTGPSAIETAELKQVFPKYRFYYVFSTPPSSNEDLITQLKRLREEELKRAQGQKPEKEEKTP